MQLTGWSHPSAGRGEEGRQGAGLPSWQSPRCASTFTTSPASWSGRRTRRNLRENRARRFNALLDLSCFHLTEASGQMKIQGSLLFLTQCTGNSSSAWLTERWAAFLRTLRSLLWQNEREGERKGQFGLISLRREWKCNLDLWFRPGRVVLCVYVCWWLWCPSSVSHAVAHAGEPRYDLLWRGDTGMTDGRQASSALALPPLVLSFFWVASDPPPVVLWCTVGSSCLFCVHVKTTRRIFFLSQPPHNVLPVVPLRCLRKWVTSAACDWRC